MTYNTGTTIYAESVADVEIKIEYKVVQNCDITFWIDYEKVKGDRNTICLKSCSKKPHDNYIVKIRTLGENANDGWKIELLEINDSRYSLDGKVPQFWIDGDKGGSYDAPLCFGEEWCELKKIGKISF